MFCRTQVGGLVVDFAADLSYMARVGRWVLIAVEGEEGEITWISVGDGFKEERVDPVLLFPPMSSQLGKRHSPYSPVTCSFDVLICKEMKLVKVKVLSERSARDEFRRHRAQWLCMISERLSIRRLL